jgi:cytochrome c peroxidase
MTLFFEEQLSSTGTIACATCHDFVRGGVDPRTATARNPGPDGHLFTADDQRGSPGMALVMQNGTLCRSRARLRTSDHPPARADRDQLRLPHASHLRRQQGVARTTRAPRRCSTSSRWGISAVRGTTSSRGSPTRVPLVFASNLPPRLQNFVAGQTYPALFQTAFGTAGVTQQRIVDSIACYLRTLNSDQSKWDLVLHQQATLTAQEQQGLNLFNSTANGAVACKACHGDFENRVLQEGPIAGAMTTQFSGYFGSPTPIRLVFHNTGVRPLQEDLGRQNVTQCDQMRRASASRVCATSS